MNTMPDPPAQGRVDAATPAEPASTIPRQYRTRPEYDLPEVPGGPTRRYMICSTPRSGSTLLGRLLEACGLMGVPYEYLNRQIHMRPMAERLGVPPQRLSVYLDAVERVRTTANGVFGLKGHWHQLGPLLGLPALNQRMSSSVLVWIRRRDLLAQAMSYYRASETRVWSVSEGDAAPPPVDYDAAKIRSAMEHLLDENANWEAWFASQGRACIPVWYEDLLERPNEVCQAICRAVLGREIDHEFALSQSDIVKMGDDRTAGWRERFIAASRAAPVRMLRLVKAPPAGARPAAGRSDPALPPPGGPTR